MNKKTLLTSLLLVWLSMSIGTQSLWGQQPTAAPSKNEYLVKDPVWFISLGAGTQTYFGEDDSKVAFNRRLTFAPTLTVGRRMSTWVNLRLQLTGGTLHGFNDGYSGTYTRWNDKRFVNTVSHPSYDPQWDYMGWVEYQEGVDQSSAPGIYAKDPNTGEYHAFRWGESGGFYIQSLRYVGAYVDASFNILNLFGGWEPRRKVDVLPFVGVGVYQRFAHRGNLVGTFLGGSLGLNVGYKINRNFSLFTELRAAIVNDEFDGQKGSMNNNGMGSWTGGVTYSFGDPRYIDPDVDQRLSTPYNITRVKESGYCGAEYGLVLVPGGNITLGSGIDPVWGDTIPQQTVSVSPFWMDETEITNLQYREFVCWVRDYAIRQRMAEAGDMSYLDWSRPIPWENPSQMEASVLSSVVGGLYGVDKDGIKGLNAAVLNYKYEWFDSKSYYSSFSAGQGANRSVTIAKDTAYVSPNGEVVRTTITRQSYGNPIDFTNTYIVNVYPDVLSWMDDFPNARNEQYSKFYFTKSAFDNFPVVGVSWEQAEAYCAWRTQRHLEKYGTKDGFEPYRLPTEAEWEYAARNGNAANTNPWYSNSTNTSDGLSRLNSKGSNDYKDLMSPVATFLPNRFGLYDMAGNVSEWTSTTYVEAVDLNSEVVNPDYSYRATNNDPDMLKRKIIKGGSWKDASPFTRSTERAFEKQYTGRSYVGFRCVRSWSVDSKGKVK